MNIKSLLLGSAAALAVVSGAQAADAIVAAEPEPMEYVRVCDAYGTGYFYIPGTETCLRIGGRVRFDVYAGELNAGFNLNSNRNPNGRKYYGDTGINSRARFELNVDTASDTEYGPLRTNVVARWDYNSRQRITYGGADITTLAGDLSVPGISSNGTNARLMTANIQLAGFTVGLADSTYATFLNYAGAVANDFIVPYSVAGQDELNQINYTYEAGNGFRAVVALEDDGQWELDDNKANSYAPDFVLGAGYSAGAFGFGIVGGYDESQEEGAIRARIDGTFGNVSAFLMGGWNSDGTETSPGVFRKNKYAQWNGDWAVWGGVSAQFSDTLRANTQLSYDDGRTFAAVANLQWNPVQNLLIQPEITYAHFDRTISTDRSQWGGMLRFERQF